MHAHSRNVTGPSHLVIKDISDLCVSAVRWFIDVTKLSLKTSRSKLLAAGLVPFLRRFFSFLVFIFVAPILCFRCLRFITNSAKRKRSSHTADNAINSNSRNPFSGHERLRADAHPHTLLHQTARSSLDIQYLT